MKLSRRFCLRNCLLILIHLEKYEGIKLISSMKIFTSYSLFKARSLIVKRENVLRAALKLKIMAATGIALCIREVQSEDFDDYVVVNVRFIGNSNKFIVQ